MDAQPVTAMSDAITFAGLGASQSGQQKGDWRNPEGVASPTHRGWLEWTRTLLQEAPRSPADIY
jgi:hypothetical protein